MPSDEYLAVRARSVPDPAIVNARTLVERRDAIEAAMAELPIAEGVEVRHAPGVDLCTRTGADEDPWILYFHAGGFRLCSARSYRSHGSHLASACRARVALVDYRLAPEHPYPAALHDGVGAYRWLLDQGVPASRVVVAGDSAGGGLTASLLLAAKAQGLPLPAGAVCLSPWVDLTNSSPTYASNAATDAVFPKAVADEARDQYLQGADPTDLLVSPVHGDWSGMCPLLVVNSSTECLAGDAERLCQAASTAGVRVERLVVAGVHHGFQTDYPAHPEAVRTVEAMATFVQGVVEPTG